MRVVAALIIFLMAPAAYAYSGYTGICFLDALLHGFDSAADYISDFFNPTTTTTSTTSTSTTMEATTTTEPATSTTTTTTYTTTTSTTLFAGKCRSDADCPNTVEYKCNFDGNLDRITTVLFCENPGLDNSTCKGTSIRRTIEICGQERICVGGRDKCVEKA